MLDWFRKFLQKLFAPQPEPPKWWLWARNNWVAILNLIVVVVVFVLLLSKKSVVVDVLLGVTFLANILYLGYTWLNPQPEPPSPAFDPQPEPPGKE